MLIHKLKVIKHQKGNIIKILKKNIYFKKFGECYISEIKQNRLKPRFHKNSQKIFLLMENYKIVILNKKK